MAAEPTAINGGAGTDLLQGAAGADIITGGDGNDRIDAATESRTR